MLYVTRGACAGKSFSIAKPEFSIGRSPENDAVIADDTAISRRHCVICRVAGARNTFELVDQDTVNGSYVNGVRVAKAALSHGDRITAGSSTLIFLTGDLDESNELLLTDDLDTPQSTVELSHAEIAMEGGTISPVQGLREPRMEALLQFAGTVHATGGLTSMRNRILEFASRTLPCDEGVLALIFPHSNELASAVKWRRTEGLGATGGRISRTICARVVQQKVALLSRDTALDKEWRSVESLASARAVSVMAVPLLANGTAIGLIYLQSSQRNAFDESDLRFFAAIGGIGGLAIDNVQRMGRLERENEALQQRAGFGTGLIGESPAMEDICRRLKRIASADCTVLILGESGTGKELVAREIHARSGRAARPFLAVNCAVLSESLLESDLFGHEKGAFTGAVARREGKLEQANGGTLFLDEVGELAPSLQGRLLRVLQEREFERVGGNRTIKVDVRILAATNRDLHGEAANGVFRLDLFYRLNVVSLTMPPLRERASDVPLLAEYFLSHSQPVRRTLRGISPETQRCLMQYSWPGNVRELQNAIEHAMVLGRTEWILPEDLPEEIGSAMPSGTSANRYHAGLARAKKELVRRAIEEAHGDYREAASLLGIHLTYLYRLVQQLRLDV
jgi:Nif-specific regulatory protein